MKRIAWILTVLGILWMSAGAAQADWYHGPHYGPHHHGYCGPVVVRPPVVIARPVVVPVGPPPPPVVYQPVYPYSCYYQPAPAGGIYYRGRGLSIGIGW
jgi:hypothetical protein